MKKKIRIKKSGIKYKQYILLLMLGSTLFLGIYVTNFGFQHYIINSNAQGPSLKQNSILDFITLQKTTSTNQRKLSLIDSSNQSKSPIDQALEIKYNIPSGPELTKIDERQQTLSQNQKNQSSDAPYFVAEPPFYSNGGTSPQALESLFPFSKLENIINSNSNSQEILDALEIRRNAIKSYFNHFMALHEGTLYSHTRVDFTGFHYVYDNAVKVKTLLKNKGINNRFLFADSSRLLQIETMADLGYKKIDIIIDGNIIYGTTGPAISNSHYRMYQELTDQGVELMTDAISTIHNYLSIKYPDYEFRYIYQNEPDLFAFHYRNGNGLTTEYSANYDIITPDAYARSYLKLADNLASRGNIVLLPSAFAYEMNGKDGVSPNGINEWNVAMAQALHTYQFKNKDFIWRHFRSGINVYGSLKKIKGRLDWLKNEIHTYGMPDNPIRIQEVGTELIDPNVDVSEYSSEKRANEMITIINYLKDQDAGIYGVYYPQDKLPGSTPIYNGLTYSYVSESTWSQIVKSINTAIQK
ncbi:MAG: hypothetical protein WCO06_01030 [Candidatus Roizmanbacteria bacterium]